MVQLESEVKELPERVLGVRVCGCGRFRWFCDEGAKLYG